MWFAVCWTEGPIVGRGMGLCIPESIDPIDTFRKTCVSHSGVGRRLRVRSRTPLRTTTEVSRVGRYMYYDQYGRHVDPYGSHGLGYDDRGHSVVTRLGHGRDRGQGKEP